MIHGNQAPIPPFSEDSARQKVRMAEDAWNARDPDRVVLGYDNDSFNDSFILGPQDPPHSLERLGQQRFPVSYFCDIDF